MGIIENLTEEAKRRGENPKTLNGPISDGEQVVCWVEPVDSKRPMILAYLSQVARTYSRSRIDAEGGLIDGRVIWGTDESMRTLGWPAAEDVVNEALWESNIRPRNYEIRENHLDAVLRLTSPSIERGEAPETYHIQVWGPRLRGISQLVDYVLRANPHPDSELVVRQKIDRGERINPDWRPLYENTIGDVTRAATDYVVRGWIVSGNPVLPVVNAMARAIRG